MKRRVFIIGLVLCWAAVGLALVLAVQGASGLTG
jgi:hypothetical protein